ncbi:MAG: methyltransferase domain-containing protein [Bacteroidia bacterium]|nr:methyltransferase domain-containing protein [Bacteroidia bacterium]
MSHVWPITLEKRKADGQWLEVVLYNGITMLNSKEANYSYGNLQTAFKRMFKEVDLMWEGVNDVLVLGFGAGGVSQLVYKYQPQSNQVAVEASAEVLDLYKRYFKPVPNTRVVQGDALDYIREENSPVDLIIVDVYEDLQVPDKFQTRAFVKLLKQRLKPGGKVVYNKVVSSNATQAQLDDLMIWFSAEFSSVRINEQLTINRFIIAK